MGIKGLTQFIKEKSPECIQSENICTFKDKTFAIDTSIFLYQSLSHVRANGEYLRNSEGKIVSHIIGLFDKTVHYLSFGIKPIFVLDGKPPPEKWECIQERNKRAQECKEKMLTETNETEKHKLEKGTIRITKEYIDDLKRLFSLMGVSYIQGESEAESYAGELCRMGYVDAVISEDMDTLVYGCPTLIRRCLDRKEKRKEVVTTFQLSTLLQDLEMDLAQFTDLCILCGCDYCDTLPGIGPKRAYQYLKKYETIEGMIESGKFEIPDSFRNRYEKARELFRMYYEKVTPEEVPVQRSEIDYDNLSNYLIHECGMNEHRVKRSLSKIQRASVVVS